MTSSMNEAAPLLKRDVKQWIRKNELPVEYEYLFGLAIIDKDKIAA